MPPVKQKGTTPPPKGGIATTSTVAAPAQPGILSRIRPVNQLSLSAMKVSLYGRAKTGKTRLMASFPKPVLIIGAEDGTESIRTMKDVDFVQVCVHGNEPQKRPDGTEVPFIYLTQLSELMNALPTSKYKTVGIDTASSLQDLILCDILGIVKLPAQKHWGLASREQYGECSLRTKTILRSAMESGLNAVITAHERNFKDDGNDHSLIIPTIGSALQPAVANWLNGAVDYVCQTFIRQGVIVTYAEAIKGQPPTRTEEPGKPEYCLRVGPHAVYMTGFRLSPGVELPEAIADPSYEKIVKVIKGEKLE